jgi:hypothetical protein
MNIIEETMISVIKAIKIKGEWFILGGKLDGTLKLISLNNKTNLYEFKCH